MTSKLKRKRCHSGQIENVKSPKTGKAKNLKLMKNTIPTSNPILGSTTSANEENNEHCDDRYSDSSVPMTFEDVSSHQEERDADSHMLKSKETAKSWYLSPSVGGRMIKSELVFSADEKFLIIATRNTIQVFATADSLLNRSIPLKLDTCSSILNQIVTICLSPIMPNILWVASSNGFIWRIDWTTGAGADSFWTVSSTGCLHMTVSSIESLGRQRDVIFTTEARKDGGFRTTANELADPNGPIAIASRTIYTCAEPIQILRAAKDGSVIVGASGKKVLVGRLRSFDFDTVDKIKYEFRTIESKEYITSFDIRIWKRGESISDSQSNNKKFPNVVDLVLGNTRGVIFIYENIAEKLFSISQNRKTSSLMDLVPSKLHWHRQSVNSVKLSLDGNYVISGGNETVLVLWQLETGKREFLPHMSSMIESIAVSTKGTAYGVQLSDNSVIVLSTLDLLPKTNIAGIQAPVIRSPKIMYQGVLRSEGKSWSKPLIQRVPAIVNPVLPSQILLAIGPNQEVRACKPLIMSNPYLQTLDLRTCKSISSQALTRTSVTNVNALPTALGVVEPRVVHMKISSDGLWLATVDEWIPPDQDFAFLHHSRKINSSCMNCRREVYLKFWQLNTNIKTWELVSRIDMPHSLNHGSFEQGRILDLVSNPSSVQFATIGSDGTVKIWNPKARKREGILVRGNMNEVLKTWSCLRTVKLTRINVDRLDGNRPKVPATGCLSYSEDGSVLAAVLGTRDGLLYLIDTKSGAIKASHAGFVEDEIFGLGFLGQDIIVLTNKLQSFDVVFEEPRHTYKLKSSTAKLSIDQKREMIHLAIDHKSMTFAIALPIMPCDAEQLAGAKSELVVFHQEMAKPQFSNVFSTLITALLPAVSSEGFLVVDAMAEICTVLRKGTQALIYQAQSTSDLRLNEDQDKINSPLKDLEEEIEDEDEEIQQTSMEPAGDKLSPIVLPEASGEEDDDNEFPVVSQHQLTEILDAGPAFALPPIEEMFYQVASLFTNRPQSQTVW